MSTKIRHVAIHTDNHFRMANFYKTLFGMKKITAGMTDKNGNYDKERGHLSDGTIARDGETRQKNLQGCKLCKHALADPDGVLLDLTD